IDLVRVRSESLHDVKRRRRHNDFAALPSSECFGGSYPLAGFKLSGFYERFLGLGHPRKKKPGVEAHRREVRSDPSSRGFEIRGDYFEIVFFEDLLEAGLAIQRLALRRNLCERQSLGSAREQHAGLFEELAHRASSHRGFVAFATRHGYRRVFLIELASRKSVEAAHETKLGASLDPEDVWIVAVLQENDCGCIFWCDWHAREYSTRVGAGSNALLLAVAG